MKAVKVQYTVRPEFMVENKRNIRRVMDALKANPIEGMYYASYTDGDDPNTFIHINIAVSDEAMSRLSEVQEFAEFRAALKASEPVAPPKQTKLELVAAGFELGG